MLESQIQKKCLDHLHSLGAWTCKVVQGNKAGIPDGIACVPMTKEQVLKLFEKQDVIGVFVAPEFKRPQVGKVSALQERNIKQINHAGGLSGIVTSVEEMKELIKT